MKRKMQRFKRVLAGFMAATMVFTMIPQVAFAEEVKPDAEYEESIVADETEADILAEVPAETEVAPAEEAEGTSEDASAEETEEASEEAPEEVPEVVPDTASEAITATDEITENEEVNGTEQLDEESTSYVVDFRSINADIECEPIGEGYTTLESKVYSVSSEVNACFKLYVKDAKKDSKTVLASGIKLVGSNGNEVVRYKDYEVKIEGNSVVLTINNKTCDYRVEADTTDIHKIKFVIDDSVKDIIDPIDPISFSANDQKDITFELTKKNDYEDYDITVRIAYGNAAKYIVEPYYGEYVVPLNEAGYNADYTVYVSGKKTAYSISVSTDSASGDNYYYHKGSSYINLSGIAAKYTAGSDVKIAIKEGSSSKTKINSLSVTFENGTVKKYTPTYNGSLSIYQYEIVIPASEAYGDIIISGIDRKAATYKVSFGTLESCTIEDASAIATAGEDYKFKVKPAYWVENLKFVTNDSDVKVSYDQINKVYVIPAESIKKDITIYEDEEATEYKKYNLSLAKDVDDIKVDVISYGSDDSMEYTELKATDTMNGAVEYNTQLGLRITDSKSADRNAPTVTAKCNGATVPVYNAGSGYYAVYPFYIKGNIVLTVTPAAVKNYNVNVTKSNYAKVEAADLAVKGKDYSFKVSALEGYDIKNVEATVGGNSVSFKSTPSGDSLSGTYVINAADITGDVNIQVTTKNKNITVTYVSNCAKVSAVTSTAVPVEGKDQWIVEANFQFAFNAENEGNYIVSEVGIIKNSTYFQLKEGGGKVTIPAKYMTSDITIVVKTKVAYELAYDSHLASVYVSSGNRAINVYNNMFYLTSDDNEVTFTVEPYTFDYQGTKNTLGKTVGTEVKIGEVVVGKIDKNNQFTIKKEKITGKIQFNPEPVESIYLYKNGQGILSIYKNTTVNVTSKEYTGTYAIIAMSGYNEKIAPINDSHYNEKTAFLEFSDKDAGKTISIPVKVNGKTITYKFKVAAKRTSLSIKGFKNNKTTQAAGTTVEYQIVTTPANADLSDVTVSVEGTDISNPSIINGKFSINAPVAKGKEISVEIKNDKDTLYSGTITTTCTAVESAKPTLTLVRATDKYLQFKMTAPKTIDVHTQGLHYLILATEEGSDSTDAPYYTKSEDLTDDLLTVYVDQSAGKAKKYDIIAGIIQYDDKKNVQVAESKPVTKTVSTLNPYVETKLGVTTKTTKLTQGDEDVLVAVAKYSNKATYIDELGITPEVISAPVDGAEGKIFVRSGINNEVRVNVASNAPAGKYVIRLTAQVPESSDAVASTVDFTVTVAERVDFDNNVTATISSDKVYKTAGKAATNTVKLVAKKGVSTKNVVMTLDTTSQAYGITIKNGVITIPKNYAVRNTTSGDEVKVTLTDSSCAYNSDNHESTSLTFRITSKTMCFSDIKINSKSVNGQTVDYSDISYYYIKVYDEKGDAIDESLYTLKLSSNLSYDAEGKGLTASKAGGSSITATAKDGSKVSKTVNFTIGYSSSTPSAYISPIWGSGYLEPVSEYEFINDNDMLESLLGVSVYDSDNRDAVNIKVALKGAKAVYTMKDIIGTGVVFIPTAEETVITVTNNITKEKTDYKIRNINFKKQNQKKSISYKNISGKLYADYKTGARQNIVIDIKNLPKLNDGEKYVARIQYNFVDAMDFEESDYKDGYYKLAYAAGLQGTSNIELENNQLIIPLTNKGGLYNMIAGTYKFDVEIVKKDVYSGAILEVVNKPTTIPVTITKAPKATYSLTTSYKFGKDGKVSKYDYAPLTGKGTNASVEFTSARLLNANIAGTVNKFTDYFAIDDLGNLVVMDAIVFTNSGLKNNLTGYVEYEVVNTATGETSTVVTKITCKK